MFPRSGQDIGYRLVLTTRTEEGLPCEVPVERANYANRQR
jgi:hypothetical protein